ncbi:hypothetical protein FHR70_003885 [Microvirga lupini]|uniref:Uncharacterized protein n=1 Tax=Microvirga lupini TaxID=420324 RepID=A0A7W4YXP4_9HYPH|nr:hypothetical protein [Microvirga lupini]MBB3020797.1 hypothetical protein [Microvirga lupini]
MHEDSPTTRTAMVLRSRLSRNTLAAVLFVMIAYGYGATSGPGGFPSAQVESRSYEWARSSIGWITNPGLQGALAP